MNLNFHTFDGGELGSISISNDIDPQIYATLAAWFSRSTNTVEQMVEKVSENGINTFMQTMYIGYGHESIGDLVDVKMFIHGVPLYVAPLIEHYSLFRGQESSTRYIDFSKQRLFGPNQDIMQRQIKEYTRALEFMTNHLLKLHVPDTAVTIKAVKARAFDICRCLLPLGAVTNVAWFGDIRNIKGHLAWMYHVHPWSRPWAEFIYESLQKVYPASIERKLEQIRPRQPWVFEQTDLSLFEFKGEIDFGSWRDMNRHRVGHHEFHLPEQNAGIDDWYIQQFRTADYLLDYNLRDEAVSLHDYGVRLLGQKVPFRYIMPEKQAEYFIWRRNREDVHPTLQLKVNAFGKDVQEYLKSTFNRDFDVADIPDIGLGYVERRGEQTITHRTGKE